ncbi:MAG: hypothetical protein LBU05_00025, partial [Bifidobacteriaceae bacterium]|nr:hypothetical protein [Bifidobacteriaceae bacterium]
MRDGLFRFDPGDKAPNYDHIDMIVAEFDWAIEEFGPPIEALEPAQLTALANYLEAFDETPEGEPMPSADGFRGSRIAAWFYNEDDSDDGQDADDQDEWDAEDGWDADGEDEAEAEDQADAGCEHAGEGARASGRELVEGHELGRRKAGRRAVAGLALVGALVALWGGCAWHWPSDQLWIWALAAASALTFLFISLFGGSGQASSLKHWRPDAVWLHCGDSFVSVDQQGVELWRTGPVRIVRSIPWHEISQWQLGRHHERGFTRLNQRDLEQARDRALAPPTRSQTEPPPDGRDQGEPAQDSRAEGEVRPPALRLVTETGESGYLALRPISRKDPWQAAVDLQKLADQGRRCAVSDGAAVAVAAAVPGLIGHPTSVSTETAQAGLIDPAPRRRRGTGKAGSKRRRVPLASHRFAPAAGFARWFGLGLASALALLGAKLYGHGFAVLGAGLVTVAVLPAGAAAGLSWSLRRPPPTRPAIVRLALALVLAAVGAGIVIGPAMLLDWFDASPNPRATTVLAGNGKYETTTARPGMGVGELDELDLSADPVHWVGRRVPADPPADPDRVRGLRTMIEQSVAALETQFPDAGLRLAA